jgi:2'-5' RNA ligase
VRVPELRGDQRRIGVAVPIPEPYAEHLQRVRAELGDPLALFIPPHVTLVAPTAVLPEQLPSVQEHLADVAAAHEPFVLELQGTASFRPVSPVVFVRVVRGAETCRSLEEAARAGVLAQELRFAYHPHVTIAHDLEEEVLDQAEAAMADFRATFVVDRFALFEHGADGVWRAVRDLVLTGTPVPGADPSR